ncbi:MAG: 9-O-acetylesterase [Phycisphaerae bacterium]|nr:9-O-acetylesterase [Phycisphaerae bacterium]
MKKRFIGIILTLCLWTSIAMAGQNLKLASLFASDMVLQQQTQAAIWGWAKPNETITIVTSWDNKVVKTGSDTDGKWKTTVKTPDAGGPYTVVVKSSDETITLENVLIGEVWICSGQSNMQWRMKQLASQGTNMYQADIDKANYPNIRYCLVRQRIALEPQEECELAWSICKPGNVPEFSAVAFFFGMKLHSELNVPIGLISTNWGGTPAQAWTSGTTLEREFPEYKATMGKYPEIIKQGKTIFHNWQKEAKGLGINHHSPSGLYNGMIEPLVPFAIRGAIWYQGESNRADPMQYRRLFPAMIKDWRNKWSIGDFPFYYVQIAPFWYNDTPPSTAYLREAQMMTLALPNTGMAVTMDIGNEKNIHPLKKKPVGNRLALWALAKDYGKDIVFSGPIYQKYKVEGNKIRLQFDYVGNGLESGDSKELTHFTIAGEDKVFVQAKAVIDGETIVVSSDKVAKPVAVRFAWGHADMPNLTNKDGLPASSFRTDDWEIGK